MTFTDKRTSERALESEARSFQLRIDTADGFREGHVLDISHRAMRVAFPEGLGEGMDEGVVIADAHLVSEAEGLEAPHAPADVAAFARRCAPCAPWARGRDCRTAA